jgi:hypothetical protein
MDPCIGSVQEEEPMNWIQPALVYLRDVEKGGVFAPEATILVLNEAHVYIETAGIRDDRKGFLFRTSRGRRATGLPKSHARIGARPAGDAGRRGAPIGFLVACAQLEAACCLPGADRRASAMPSISRVGTSRSPSPAVSAR